MLESSGGSDLVVNNNKNMTFYGVTYINDGITGPGSPAASFSGNSQCYAEVTLNEVMDVTAMSWIMKIYRSGLNVK